MPIVEPPSLTLVSVSAAWISRADSSSAARCDSVARSATTPPASPPVSVSTVTRWPWEAWRSRIPPMPISTSSGCAPTASTTSSPAARRSRVTAISACAFSISPGGSNGLVR